MNQPGYAEAYRAAIETAMDELDNLFHETSRLQDRMDRIESVLAALEPMFGSTNDVVVQDRRPTSERREPVVEPVHVESIAKAPVEVALPRLVAQRASESDDPIQRRIDSILGLAVA